MNKLMLLLLLTAPSLAFAEEPRTEPDVVYAKRTVVDFSTVTISGEIERPAGMYMMAKKKPRFRTLIRVRGGFLPEIVHSVDKL